MPYAIIFYDKSDSSEVRAQLRDAHIEYMDANKHRLLASGGLLTDDGSTGHGGVIILDTDSRDEAEVFLSEDPFYTGGLYGEIKISRWRKAFFDAKRFV